MVLGALAEGPSEDMGVAATVDAHIVDLPREMEGLTGNVVVVLNTAHRDVKVPDIFIKKVHPVVAVVNESFIPHELFGQISPTQRSIFLQGRNASNAQGANTHQDQHQNHTSWTNTKQDWHWKFIFCVS
jgi:hypothetical protein